MITTVGMCIINNLSREIRDSKYFSVVADEAADASNKENLSIVIRFVDRNQTIREEFVGFLIYVKKGQPDEPPKDLILNAVADLGLSMDDCRGQCYAYMVFIYFFTFLSLNLIILILLMHLYNGKY